MTQNNLAQAKNVKNDEFYTQYSDIEKEINAYFEYNPNVFRDKTILLPCDSKQSNFTKYFKKNLKMFKLKKLIYINKDFRSKEVKKLRDEADIIITNPPFSLFREFLAWILEANKKFIIIGNLNTVANKEVFPLIRDNIIWLGATNFNGGATYFIAPKELYDSEKMSNKKNAYMKDGKFYWRVNGVRWYTNIGHGIRHHPLKLMSKEDNLKFNNTLLNNLKKKYELDYYPKYNNYDAIEVPMVSAIPDDYEGEMGVPVSFMDKYCPEQFEIIGIGIGKLGEELGITPIPKEIDKSLPGHSSVWRFYIMVGDRAVIPYSRIIIKRKIPKKEREQSKQEEIKWLQSVLDTKHIMEEDRWIIEGRLDKLKQNEGVKDDGGF